MCWKCNQPIFPGIRRKAEQRIGAVVYWATSPIWGAFGLALAIVALPFMLFAAAYRYAHDRKSPQLTQEEG